MVRIGYFREYIKKSVPERRGPPPPDAALHLLELFRNDGCIASSLVKFLFCLEQILLRVVMVVRMHKLVDEFGGLLAYGAFGVDVNVGGLGEMRYAAWA